MKNVSRYLIVVIMLFVSSCNNLLSLEQIKLPSLEQLGLSKSEKFQYLSGIPVNMYIDESNNGIILIDCIIYKIKDLNITNEEIELKDNDKEFCIGDILYSVDKDGNGVLIYSKNKNTKELVTSSNDPYSFYLVNIVHNKFKNESTKPILDIVFSKIKMNLVNISKDKYMFYYLPDKQGNNKDNDIKIKVISKDKIEDYLYDKNIDPRTKTYSLNLDENGNGLYLSNEILNFRIFSVNNFTKGDEKFNIQFRNVNESNKSLIKSSSDNFGNGYILTQDSIQERDLQTNSYNLYIHKFSDFKNISDKELFFSTIDIEIGILKKDFSNTYIDKKKNGIIILAKKNNPPKKSYIDRDFDYSYLYTKKISNLKVEDKEIKLLDSNKYFYHDFKINEKGNGLVILKKNDSENTFIVKKIINFEPEK